MPIGYLSLVKIYKTTILNKVQYNTAGTSYFIRQLYKALYNKHVRNIHRIVTVWFRSGNPT